MRDPQAARQPEGSEAGPEAETGVKAEQRCVNELERVRKSIDNLDAALIHILAERFRCTHQVGQIKAERGLPATDREREAEQLRRFEQLARESNLDPTFAQKLLRAILDEVVRHHEVLKQRGSLRSSADGS